MNRPSWPAVETLETLETPPETQVFTNCKVFNKFGSAIWYIADYLQAKFERLFQVRGFCVRVCASLCFVISTQRVRASCVF